MPECAVLGDAGRESCENHVSTDFAVAHSLVWKHSSKEAATCYRSVLTRGQPYAGRGKTALLRKCRELAPMEPVPPIPVGTSVCFIVFVKHLWLGTWEDARCPHVQQRPPGLPAVLLLLVLHRCSSDACSHAKVGPCRTATPVAQALCCRPPALIRLQ